MKNKTRSLSLAKQYLGKEVSIVIDRPLGSKHPEHGFVYQVNYGYVPGTQPADGEELDAYYLGVSKPLHAAEGRCIAIIHRLNDDDDKLVVVPKTQTGLTDSEIAKAVNFQERWFDCEILRTRTSGAVDLDNKC